MDKYEIVRRIEEFAPLETAEKWDCSGWLVETRNPDVKKIMLALTVTDDVVSQTMKCGCDMVISHHPLFEVPIRFKNIDIYCAHTNLDAAKGGTTDTLIEKLRLSGLKVTNIQTNPQSFVRYVETNVKLSEFLDILSKISPNLRYTNSQNIQNLNKIGFCAGSGAEFITEAAQNGADGFVTGDLKFHAAIESPIPVFDVGHFESEIQVLSTIRDLIGNSSDVVFAFEESPFKKL